MKTPWSFRVIRFSLKILGCLLPNLAAQIFVKLFTSPRRHTRPQWEADILGAGQTLKFKNGLVAHCWGTSGPQVLLVHGWEGRGTQLGSLVQPLVDRGYRVIALDGPAHGDSPGTRTNVRFFAKALREVVIELGPLHMIVAHSFGAGATALALVTGLDAERVVLVASPADLEWVVDDFEKKMQMSSRVARRFRRRLEEWAGISVSEIQIAKMAQGLQVRALIVHDPEDREVPYQSAKKIAENWPGSHLLALEKVGHRRILKSPRFIEAVIEFASA